MHIAVALSSVVFLISATTHHVPAAHRPVGAHHGAATPKEKIDRPPGAYILVDNDTGNVLQESNEHERMSPASTTKLLTSLVAISTLPPNTSVTINSDVENVPALKMGLKAGDVWTLNDLLHATLLVSANDAALALADATSGNAQAFAIARAQAAMKLGLTDSPVFNSPAGLDDSTYGTGGGDLVSAHDMAIIGRAALASPVIRSIVAEKRYDFTESDGSHHHMLNHNQLITTYPGAIGLKTGYTKKAQHTLVAAAARDGRTMLAVVLDASDPDATATHLLDQGFGTPVDQEVGTEHLNTAVLPTYTAPAKSQAVAAVASKRQGLPILPLAFAVAGGIAIVLFFAAYNQITRRRELLQS